MDFFKAQEQARKKTRWLVVWFGLAVVGIMALACLGYSLLRYALNDPVWEIRIIALSSFIFFACIIYTFLILIARFLEWEMYRGASHFYNYCDYEEEEERYEKTLLILGSVVNRLYNI